MPANLFTYAEMIDVQTNVDYAAFGLKICRCLLIPILAPDSNGDFKVAQSPDTATFASPVDLVPYVA